MRGEVERFSSGWVGLALRMRAEERDALIDALRRLPESGHFHLRAKWETSNEPGIADVEISLQGENEFDNLVLEP